MAALEIEIFKVRHAPTSPKATQTVPLNLVIPNPGYRGSGHNSLARLFRSPSACARTEKHPILQAVSEKSGKKEFTFNNAQVTPKESLWTACIDVTI